MARRKRLMVLGFDSLMPFLVDKFVGEGRMPAIKKLIDEGTYTHALPVMPTLTPINWTTIATGAYAGTHGVTCFDAYYQGDPVDKLGDAFVSGYRTAEALWESWSRRGKRAIVMTWPGSYPIDDPLVTQVGGTGTPFTYQSYFGLTPTQMLYSTEPVRVPGEPHTSLPMIPLELSPAEGWEGVPAGVRRPLESSLYVLGRRYAPVPAFAPKNFGEPELAASFALLVIDSRGCGYDRVLVCGSKDARNPLAVLEPGVMSGWITSLFETGGRKLRGAFKLMLTDLPTDGSRLRVYMTQAYPLEGFSSPPDVARELVQRLGPWLEQGDEKLPAGLGWIDDRTYLDEVREHARWYGDAARHLLSKGDWDLFMMKWHLPDHLAHGYLGRLDPLSPMYSEAREAHYWSVFREAYGYVDEIAAKVLGAATDEDVICVVSDHGHIAIRDVFFKDKALINAGLLSVTEDGHVDYTKTTAFPQRFQYVYVNLEGRDPGGIVKPGREYEEVRDRVIAALLEVVDPRTGKHPVNMAIRREDAQGFGLYGPRVGDVVFTLEGGYAAGNAFEAKRSPIPVGNPVLFDPSKVVVPYEMVGHVQMTLIGAGESSHGQYLPSCTYGIGSMKALAILKGPGFKRGYRRPQAISLTDVAPTLCYAVGEKPPAQSEGAVVFDALEG